MDRSRQIHKFGYDNFALCCSVAFNDHLAKSQSISGKVPRNNESFSDQSHKEANSFIDPSEAMFLKIHLYSTQDIHQTTTIHVPIHLTLGDVFNQLCIKYKYDRKEYVLKIFDKMIDAPLDKTLQQAGVSDCFIVKRGRGVILDVLLDTPRLSTSSMAPDFRVSDFGFKV